MDDCLSLCRNAAVLCSCGDFQTWSSRTQQRVMEIRNILGCKVSSVMKFTAETRGTQLLALALYAVD